jgi:chaperonin GroEL
MIKTDKQPLEIIQKVVTDLVDLVKPTYGANGKKVMIANAYSTKILDDGVSVAKAYKSENQMENVVLDVIKEVAIKTNDRVGDGTTTSLIMVGSIISQLTNLELINSKDIAEGLNLAAKEAIEVLRKQKKDITTVEELEKVARISFDNADIAKVIAELVHKVGQDGVIAVQEANTMETTAEFVEGFSFDKGYISPYMVTNVNRMEATFDGVPIIVTDYRVSSVQDLMAILIPLTKDGIREAVLIAEDLTGEALHAAVMNKIKGQFNLVAIQAPGFGSSRTDYYQDIAAITGAEFISQGRGMQLKDFKPDMVGSSESIIIRPKETIILGGKGDPKVIGAISDGIKVAIEKEENPYAIKSLKNRLAKLNNGIAVIKVGSPTQAETIALKEKIEDAVNAVKVAYNGGVVAGSGLALSRIKTSNPVLNIALAEPFKQIMANSNYPPVEKLGEDDAYNVVTAVQGNFMDVGVVDPVEVLIAGIESAVSIATMLITTSAIFVDIPDAKELQDS